MGKSSDSDGYIMLFIVILCASVVFKLVSDGGCTVYEGILLLKIFICDLTCRGDPDFDLDLGLHIGVKYQNEG